MDDLERFDRRVGLIALAALVVGCLLVLRPFVSSVLWALVLSYTTWPMFLRVRHALRGRSALAALTMTVLLAVVIVVPVMVLGFSLGDNVAPVVDAGRRIMVEGLPDPPHWVASLPLIGGQVEAYLREMAHDSAKLMSVLAQLLDPLKSWLLSGGLKLGEGLLYLVLSVVLAFFFYRDGDAVSRGLDSALTRIAGARAARLKQVAGDTVASVVYGILGTGLAQGVMAALGLRIAGVPGSLLWGTLTFFLSVVPVGPPLVWISATVWLVFQGSIGWAVFMAVWGFFGISGIDNVVKPYLISRGSRLPFILTLLGVLGGALAFGIVGVFLGPTLLAVGFRLLQEWIARDSPPALLKD
jgi:predicted PurR-regulated permease PerM